MNTPLAGKRWLTWVALPICLVLPIVWLFRALLEPGQVMFSNDGPLGALYAQSDNVLQTFTGLWRPLNWVGNQDPSSQPDLTMGLFVLLRNPVLFSKLYAASALAFLGLSAWFFCRRSGFHPVVGALAAAAAALNSNAVSYACWGLPPKAISEGLTLLARGLANGSFSAGWSNGVRVWRVGACVGMNVVEGADVGAILSLYVASFLVWQIFAEQGSAKPDFLRGGKRLLLVPAVAGLIAAHSLSSLVGTQIKGVAGMDRNSAEKDRQWEFATFGSLPPAETLRIIVPGLFGYRMDSPKGGAYWGGVGSDGKPEHRFSGSGEYVGILVFVFGLFAVANSLRKDEPVFSRSERKYVWFWGAAALLSLLIAYGRFAPFYRLIFELPYFSTIRFPMKFLHGMDVCFVILFGYGLEAFSRIYLTQGVDGAAFKLRSEARKKPGWEGRWLVASWVGVAVAVVTAIIYTTSYSALEQYLSRIPFQDERASAWFSIGEVWKAVAFLIAAVGFISVATTGWFSGSRSHTAWCILAAILIIDLLRANVPWVKTYDYRLRYKSNVVLDVLKEKPWEQRVSAYLVPQRAGLLVATTEFAYLQKEWLENHFQYYRIQSLDIDQMPRMPELDGTYMKAFQPSQLGLPIQIMEHFPELGNMPAEQAKQVADLMPVIQTNLFYITRLWELTNTRFVIGWAQGIDRFNEMFDPAQKRFRIRQAFGLALKEGAETPPAGMPIAEAIQAYTAVPTADGPLALIEFTGALPRVKLYSKWSSSNDDRQVLSRLISPGFAPGEEAIVSGSVPDSAATPSGTGEARVVSYLPRQVIIDAKVDAQSLLVLNDRWAENWRVMVDGSAASLLRANYLMRGVLLSPGKHRVEFLFQPPSGPFWVSLGAILAAIICALVLGLAEGRPRPQQTYATQSP